MGTAIGDLRGLSQGSLPPVLAKNQRVACRECGASSMAVWIGNAVAALL